jgi:hypothetical protein
LRAPDRRPRVAPPRHPTDAGRRRAQRRTTPNGVPNHLPNFIIDAARRRIIMHSRLAPVPFKGPGTGGADHTGLENHRDASVQNEPDGRWRWGATGRHAAQHRGGRNTNRTHRSARRGRRAALAASGSYGDLVGEPARLGPEREPTKANAGQSARAAELFATSRASRHHLRWPIAASTSGMVLAIWAVRFFGPVLVIRMSSSMRIPILRSGK